MPRPVDGWRDCGLPEVRAHEHRIELRTRRSSEREPADSLRDKTNVIGGWLSTRTSEFGGIDTSRDCETHKGRGGAPGAGRHRLFRVTAPPLHGRSEAAEAVHNASASIATRLAAQLTGRAHRCGRDLPRARA